MFIIGPMAMYFQLEADYRNGTAIHKKREAMGKEENKSKSNPGKRIAFSVIGVALCGASVGVFKYAALGVDPFQTLMAGLDAFIPLDFGLLYIIVNALLLIFSLIFDRHYIGIATFINLFLLGYITQFALAGLQLIHPEPALWVRIICMVVAVVMNCLAASLYMTADLGVSTYDAIALIICNTWKKGKFRYLRIATDLTCIVIGVAFFLMAGGKAREIPTIVGFGTIITAFLMGPLIEVFNKVISRPLMGRKEE